MITMCSEMFWICLSVCPVIFILWRSHLFYWPMVFRRHTSKCKTIVLIADKASQVKKKKKKVWPSLLKKKKKIES